MGSHPHGVHLQGQPGPPRVLSHGLAPSSALGDRDPETAGRSGCSSGPAPGVLAPMRAQHPFKCTSCQPPICTHLSLLLPAAWTAGWAFTPIGPQGFKDSGRFRSSRVHPPGSASKGSEWAAHQGLSPTSVRTGPSAWRGPGPSEHSHLLV